jgi:hypothetical protein
MPVFADDISILIYPVNSKPFIHLFPPENLYPFPPAAKSAASAKSYFLILQITFPPP